MPDVGDHTSCCMLSRYSRGTKVGRALGLFRMLLLDLEETGGVAGAIDSQRS